MKHRIAAVLILASALLILTCRREAAAPSGTATTGSAPASTSTAPAGKPQNLGDAKINTVVSSNLALFITNSRVGSALGADGLVAEEKTEFAAGENIHLTMWLKESPSGLQTSATLVDRAEKEVDVERKAMKGEKTVTFSLGDKKLKPGTYKLTGFWGGNIAAEHEVTVVARGRARAKAKGRP